MRKRFAWSAAGRLSPAVLFAVLAASGQALGQPGAPPTPPPKQEPTPEEKNAAYENWMRRNPAEWMRKEANRLINSPGMCGGARMFALGIGWIPMAEARTVYASEDGKRYLSDKAWNELPESERAAWTEMPLGEEYFYHTRYGSPLAYFRPLDIICKSMNAGISAFEGKRILDFGYGTIGHLRLLAQAGADTVGVDVDPILKALYSREGDTGTVERNPNGQVNRDGSITLVEGKWPSTPEVKAAVGSGFDIIMSKNTLKNGYINPEKPVDERMLVKLGVDNETFVKEVAAALKPGGYFMIYNISPKQSEEQYMPWADGRCPFPREMLERHGLEVLEFDTNDDTEIRKLGEILEWNQGAYPMDLENDCFALYTLARKRTESKPEEPPKP